MIKCWHFAAGTLRDGSPLPKAGELLPVIDNPVPCERGYHGSVRAIDALRYAPGPFVARVWLSSDAIPHSDSVDKYCASQRCGITDYVDCSEALDAFARACAVDVIHLWDAPDVVREYLHHTGDEQIRAAANAAARDASRSAAGYAAWAAVWAASRSAAGYAANAAAGYAAWAASRSAARDASRSAAGYAANAAARAAQNERLETMLFDALGLKDE